MLNLSTGGTTFFVIPDGFRIIFGKKSWKEAGRNKKAGRIPVYDDVGSAKNPLPERQRNAQQDTKTQWSLLVFRCLGAKEHILKLGGFTSSFAEITDKMSTETGFREGGIRFQNTIYPHVVRKSRRFSAFFGVFIKSREKGRFASPLRWGTAGGVETVSGYARTRSWWFAASLGAAAPPRKARLRSHSFPLPRGANGKGEEKVVDCLFDRETRTAKIFGGRG